MRIIVGLGNPGKEYENTSHNIGFKTVDKLADDFSIPFSKKGYKAVYGEGKIGGEKIMLVKPQTYMNNSGECLLMLKSKFKDARILVIVDDIDTERGNIKYKQHGSGGTHNGLRDIVRLIGEEFERLKLGIGKPDGDLKDFVLHKMDSSLQAELVEKACQRVEEWLR